MRINCIYPSIPSSGGVIKEDIQSFFLFILCNEESHSMFDVGLLPPFKPCPFIFPWRPTPGRLIRKPGFSLWHWRESQTMQAPAHHGTLSTSLTHGHHKNPGRRPLFALSGHIGLFSKARPALPSPLSKMLVINLFIPY